MIAGLQNISALSLARGLGATSNDGTSATDASADAAKTGAASFADTMTRMASDVETNLRQAEKLSIDGIKGKASTRAAVDAVMTAQQSLQTAIAIRNQIASAYLEITRMTI